MFRKLILRDRSSSLPLQTIGGWLAWEDIYIRNHWRIQRNFFYRNLYRLVDEKYRYKASGTKAHCLRELEKVHKKKTYKKVVVLIHGVLCHRIYMERIAKRLEKEGFTVFNFGYASNAFDISHHGSVIHDFVKQIQYKEIHFVTFSMGGLVVRQFVNKVKKVKRLVMISPPNKGSDMADLFGEFKLIRKIFGPGMEQMKTSLKSFANKSPIPKCEFGIIGGKVKKYKSWWRPTRIIYAVWRQKDNDGLVGIEQMKLPHMKDFVVLPYDHAVIPFKKKTVEQVVSFLRRGEFKH